MAHDLAVFGDRRSFAIEAGGVADPHPGSAPLDDAGSYGDFRLYVRGRCLTRHTVPDGVRDEVRWYLAPLARWIASAWIPLFHEQGFPFPVGAHEHTIVKVEQAERVLLDDETEAGSERRAEMQAWRRRHALWTGAAGGIFPNVWFRRQSDLCEISFDPGPSIGAPERLSFQFNRGATLIDIDVVAEAMLAFVRWAERTFGLETIRLASLDGVTADALEARDWLIGSALSGFLSKTRRDDSTVSHNILYPLAPEVAMFGTLRPDLSDKDAAILIGVLETASSADPEHPRLSSLTFDAPVPSRETSWAQGYEEALEFLDRLDLPNKILNMNELVLLMGIALEFIDIGDPSLRGIAIAGPGFRPTICINLSAKRNKGEPGRRFTIAHELCHILFDRGRARRITHSSTPWAPEAVERRANAFAAMLLMPYKLVDRILLEEGQVVDLASLRRVARRLKCGTTAVLDHLKNIDRIGPSTYYDIEIEMAG